MEYRDVTASDSVLRALGVDREEYTQVKEEGRQRQEESIRVARAEGKRLYGELQSANFGVDTRSVYLGDGLRIPIPDPADKTSQESMTDAADRVIGYMERAYQLPPDQLQTAVHADQDRQPAISPDNLKLRMRYVIEGFAASTIEKNGWFTNLGLRAVNTVTPGGILENPYILNLIKERSVGDRETAVYFADEIQRLQTPSVSE